MKSLTSDTDFATALVASIWPNSTYVPGISLFDFISESLKRSKTSYSTLQVALYYIIMLKANVPVDRFTQEQTGDPSQIPLQCGRRMFLSVLMLGSKYLQDKNYSTTAWSKITGLSCAEINSHERQVLLALDYRLHIPKDIFANWNDLVISLCQRTRLLPAPVRVTFGAHKELPSSWQSFVQTLHSDTFTDRDEVRVLTDQVWKDALSIPMYEALRTHHTSSTNAADYPRRQPTRIPPSHLPPSPPDSRAGTPLHLTGSTGPGYHRVNLFSGATTLPLRPNDEARRPSLTRMDIGSILQPTCPTAETVNPVPTRLMSHQSDSKASTTELACGSQYTRITGHLSQKTHRRRTPSPLAHELRPITSHYEEIDTEKTPVPMTQSDTPYPPNSSPLSSQCSNYDDNSDVITDDESSLPSLDSVNSTQTSLGARTPVMVTKNIEKDQKDALSYCPIQEAAATLLQLGQLTTKSKSIQPRHFDNDSGYDSLGSSEEESTRINESQSVYNNEMHLVTQTELLDQPTPRPGQIIDDPILPHSEQPHRSRLSRKNSARPGSKRSNQAQTDMSRKRSKTEVPIPRKSKDSGSHSKSRGSQRRSTACC